MPYAVAKFQETPNPNAIKCVLDRRASDRPRSYFDAASAAEDPIASRLFAIEGVTNVLINGDWITVNKGRDASWAGVKRGIERVLREVE